MGDGPHDDNTPPRTARVHAPGTAALARRQIGRFARRLRRRSWLLAAIRLGLLATGALVSTFALASWLVGPLAPLWKVGGAWAALLAACAGLGWLTLRERRENSLPKLLGRLSAYDPTLPSRACSALELGKGTPRGSSDALVEAHLLDVSGRLARIPPARLLPWAGLWQRPVWLALGATLLAAVLLGGNLRVQAGALSLLHPAVPDADGQTRAPVLKQLRVRLVYPSYMQRSPETLVDPARIEAPRGTTIELTARPYERAAKATVELGGRQLSLRAQKDGFVGKVVARDSGPLRFRIHHDGRWLEDSRVRHLDVARDQAPHVRFAPDVREALVDPGEPVSLPYVAGDDIGLEQVEMITRLPDGSESRRRAWSRQQAGMVRQVERAVEVSPERYGAGPGDTLVVWLEARDGDVVSGPHVTRSQGFSIHVASPATRRSQALARMADVLGQGLDVLADRLESEVPAAASQARRRFSALQDATHSWLQDIDALTRPEGDEAVPNDLARLRRTHEAVTELLRSEAQLHRRDVAPLERRQRADERTVATLESHLLQMADLLQHARIDEAGALAEELSQLRTEIADLLQKLRDAPSPEAQRALLSEIAQAQRRMRELQHKLGQLAQDVPDEFANAQAAPQSESGGSFEALRDAVERGDLEEAERQLAALDEQLGNLGERLKDSDLRFTRSRFGEEQQAMAKAARGLDALRESQTELVERSEQVARRALERAGQLAQEDLRGARGRAERAASAADALGDTQLGPFHDELAGRAEQRLSDARAALDSGDLLESRRMAAQAREDLDELSRQLEMDSRMFPGHEGRTAEAARRAREAAGAAGALEEALEHSAAKAQGALSEGERDRLRDDAKAQRRTRSEAESLAERMGRGEEGLPASPDMARQLQEAAQGMGQAERMLERGRPSDAAARQRESLQALEAMKQDLEQQAGGGEGRGRSRRSADGRLGGYDMDTPVDIPGREAFRGPVERRRQLLDAMREDSPQGYDGSLERYYEELLR